MEKREVSAILEEIGTLLELKGENPFKVRAYYNAAQVLGKMSEEIDVLVKTGELAKVKGIGQALNEKITTLVTTGRLPYYEELKRSFPEGLLEILRVPGLGPKRVKILYEKLGISSLGELEYACHENRLLELDGFGKKLQEKILEGITALKKYQGQYLYDAALSEAKDLVAALSASRQVIRISIAGSLRRVKEVVKDVDLVVSTGDGGGVAERFTHLPHVEEVIAQGETKAVVRLASGVTADLRIVTDKEFPYALHHSTGSKEHNVAMRGRAKKMGITMNEYGLFRAGDALIPCRDEEEIFQALGLAYIPPELREAMGEIEAAEAGSLPRLIEPGDIKGIFHTHTTYSDGGASLEEMIHAAQALGYQYIGISDHSKSAYYARGLKEDRLRKQKDEIEHLREKFPKMTIFWGAEVDILPDGSLDYSDRVLVEFDFVIASVHSKFQMTEEEATQRIVAALGNPHVTMLGHPTGRLLLAREGYPINLQRVIEAAAERNVAIELNANPHRLDLDWRLCRYAKDKGVKVSINPDAHSIEGLTDTAYGVAIARKGWLTASDVLNTLPAARMAAYLSTREKAALG